MLDVVQQNESFEECGFWFSQVIVNIANNRALQFPIKVSFAIKINMAEGLTFQYVGIDLRSDCFSHGHELYVGQSRTSKPPKNQFVLLPEV